MVSSRTFDLFEGDRLLFLVFAPEMDDDRLDGQLLCLSEYKEGFLERNAVLYTILEQGESMVGGESLPRVDADSLRMRFGVGHGDFVAILVDKDGTEAQKWDRPVPPAELFRRIDEVETRASGDTSRQTG